MAGATLEFTFKDKEVQAMARRFREQLARVRFRPLLAAIGNELVTSVSRRFETGTAPDGSRWPESLRARLTGGQTLIKSGRLRDSIAETGPQLTARSVEVGTNVVYAAIHQFGGIIPPHIIRARRARALSIPGIGFRRAVHVDQVGRLKAALSQAADDFARPFNDAISSGIAMLLDSEGLSGKQLLGGAAAAGVAGYGALKLAGMGLSRLGSKAAGGLVSTVARQAGLAGLKLPLPVYVVNKQMSLTREAMLGQSGGAPAAPGAPGGKKAGKGKTVSGAQLDGAKSAGRGAAVLTAAATVAPVLFDPDTSMAQKVDVATDAAGGLAGGWAGTAAGAKAGAFLGGFLGPFGAAAGGVVGGVAGGILGSELGQSLVSTVKNWLGVGEGENQALQKTMQTFLTSMQQVVAAIPTGGIAVDVNVTGNAQAAIRSSNGNIDSGLSYSRQIANEMME